MATWSSVENYLFSNYRCEKLEGGAIKLIFDMTDTGRTQVVLVVPGGPDALNPSWMDMHSPIGDLGTFSIETALQETAKYVAGGLSLWAGSIVTVRNSIPLADLDANEIDEPMRVLCALGDLLESQLTGQDAY